MASASVTILGAKPLPSVMTAKGDSYQGKKPWLLYVLFGVTPIYDLADIMVDGYTPKQGDIVKIQLDANAADGESHPDLTEVISAQDTAGAVDDAKATEETTGEAKPEGEAPAA